MHADQTPPTSSDVAEAIAHVRLPYDRLPGGAVKAGVGGRVRALGVAAALAAALGTSLVLAPAATAATRFAAPGGSGSECTRAAPCRIHDAVEFAGSGDEVVLLGGAYALAEDTLDVSASIDVHGQPGGPTARLVFEPSVRADAVHVFGAGSRLADLTVLNQGRGSAVRVEAADVRIDRVTARVAVGDGLPCRLTGDGILLANSICHNAGGGEGLGVAIESPPGGAAAVVLRNVTAITDGDPLPSNDGSAIFAVATGGPLQVDAFNVIAQSSGPIDIAASGPKPAATIDLRSSNYRTESESGDATITDPGAGTNQTAPPSFLDTSADDFRQAPGSPTIDAGESADALGPFDFEGDARIQGARVDIGADEIEAPPEPPDASDDSVTIRIKGKRLLLRRRRLVVKLTCPAAEQFGPCRGRVVVKTRGKVRFGGNPRRVRLAATRYEVPAGRTKRVRVPITGSDRTVRRKAHLLRRSGKARRVETVAQVRDALDNRGRTTKPQRVRLLLSRSRG